MEVLAIVGPTGSGKSDLALDIAQNVAEIIERPAEIINADAFSLYRGMDIGTAKVLPNEYRGIPHHLIDVLDCWQEGTLADYQAAGRLVIDQIVARGRLPIVVGGSGLYVRALLDGLDLPGTDPLIRQALTSELELLGIEVMFTRLQTLDPAAATAIGNRNARRIIRALEVIELTGQPFTAQLPNPEYLRPTVTIGLDFRRELLDARIARRVDLMRELGLLAEVRSLADASQGGVGPGLSATAARAVGYAELIPVLRGELADEVAFEQISAHTRRLTRKQMTWFGRDPRIKWFDGAAPNLLSQALTHISRPDVVTQVEPTNEITRTPLGSIAN